MKIRFDPVDHAYFNENGTRVPSVTQVLHAAGVCNYDFLCEEKKRECQDRGTNIHWLLQLADEGALNRRNVKPTMRGYLKAWENWKKASGFVPTAIEQIFGSEYGYAGTADRIGHFADKPKVPVCLDLKTGSVIPAYVNLQLIAYVYGLIPQRDRAATRRIAFQPYSDGTFTVKEYPTAAYLTDFAKFMDALRRSKNGN